MAVKRCRPFGGALLLAAAVLAAPVWGAGQPPPAQDPAAAFPATPTAVPLKRDPADVYAPETPPPPQTPAEGEPALPVRVESPSRTSPVSRTSPIEPELSRPSRTEPIGLAAEAPVAAGPAEAIPLAGARAASAAPHGAEPPIALPIPLPEPLAEAQAAAGLAVAPPAAAGGGIPLFDAADLDAWLDGLVPAALARGGLSGAVVSVVKDGRLLTARGYGLADRGNRRPMDPARTLVRPGSISKLFTWVAVMQQVERGRLDLDADVNRYLDFRIPAYDGKPITLRQLMTHTAGFEESAKHLFAATPQSQRRLGDYLKAVLPQRIYPPGQVPAYSNYGVALAGYIVERTTAQRFEDYIQAQVLDPLGMRHSSFRQPLPEALAADLARGYARAGGAPVPFERVNPAPAGALSATAEDMARFMLAMLDQGRLDGRAVLQPASVQAMHAAALRPIPGLDAIGLGWFRRDGRGPLAVGHGGATEAFQSQLVLLPAHRLGVFVSVDGPARAGRGLHRDLVDGLIARYFPSVQSEPPTLASARVHGQQVAGLYENSRGAQTQFLVLARFFGAARVRLHEDSTLSVSTLLGRDGRPKRWREVGAYLWREVDGESLLAARMDRGRVVALSSDDVPAAMWLQPVPASRSPAWLLPALVAALAVQSLALAAWPVAALVRRHYLVPLSLDARQRRLRALMLCGLAANLAGAALWVWILARIEATPRALDGGLDAWIVLARALGAACVASAVVALVRMRDAWRGVSVLERVCTVWVAAACLVLAWAVFALRLLGWSLVY